MELLKYLDEHKDIYLEMTRYDPLPNDDVTRYVVTVVHKPTHEQSVFLIGSDVLKEYMMTLEAFIVMKIKEFIKENQLC